MNMLRRKILLFLLLPGLLSAVQVQAHKITFCGEVIPMDNDFVANKLMNVIRKQIPNVNLPALRTRAMQYFPVVNAYLLKHNIPTDFKYLPIVESGFAILTSRVGAHGYWQLMPGTAKQYGLIMNGQFDERENIDKATQAACRLLKDYYMEIFKKQKVTSWVLTAAAYNFGIGNILKAIQSKGKDYFNMNLNPETAVYVYKIIAVKELFEYPELYMSNFGYNVFSATASSKQRVIKGADDNDAAFRTISVDASNKKPKVKAPDVYVGAHIKGKYKNFNDGDLLAVEIDEDLKVKGGFAKKGSVIKGTGWIIDDRVFVDLGYGHNVLLYDQQMNKGIALSAIKKGEPVLLKNDIADDESQW